MARKKNYINNQDFLISLIERKKRINENHRKLKLPISDYIGECIMQICERLGKSSRFNGYSFLDEMVGDALEKCVAGVDGFDPERIAERSGKINPFAYFTQIAWNAFLNRIEIEKKQHAIKHNNAVTNIPEFLIDESTAEATNYIIREYEEKQRIKKEKIKNKKLEKNNNFMRA